MEAGTLVSRNYNLLALPDRLRSPQSRDQFHIK